jgi:glycosyltransferase involved in cell wall biosynthesis
MYSYKKIKVAFFADILTRDHDGAIKTMYQIIDKIPEEQFEFMLCTGTPPEEKTNHKILQIPSLTLPFNANYKACIPYFNSNKLVKALEEFKPDVIHISTPSPLGFFGLNYAKKNHIPTLSIYHTHFVSYIQYYFNRLPFLIKPVESIVKNIYQSFYNFCNMVYVPTRQMINELRDCGVSNQPLKLWQRGIDTGLFNPSKKDRNFIQQLTGNDKPCILFASRLVWEKNLETLFNIYDEAEAQNLDVNFIIAGSGVAEQVSRKRMKKAFFLGFLNHEELSKVYASSDVFVFPSISETFGNVVVEAMASGCVPVIARGGGSQSLVMDGVTGFLCGPYNVNEYVENIKKVLHSPALKEIIQQNAIHYASTFNWDRLTNEYFNDLQTLADSLPIYKNDVLKPNEIMPTNYAI